MPATSLLFLGATKRSTDNLLLGWKLWADEAEALDQLLHGDLAGELLRQLPELQQPQEPEEPEQLADLDEARAGVRPDRALAPVRVHEVKHVDPRKHGPGVDQEVAAQVVP